ncbi:hypothetical protein LINPERHAP2_LOCUS20644 [Linum perenne]
MSSRLRKLIRTRRDQNRDHKGNDRFRNNKGKELRKDESSNENQVTCYKCGKPGHIRSECPHNKQARGRAMKASWSDSESEEEDDGNSRTHAHMGLEDHTDTSSEDGQVSICSFDESDNLSKSEIILAYLDLESHCRTLKDNNKILKKQVKELRKLNESLRNSFNLQSCADDVQVIKTDSLIGTDSESESHIKVDSEIVLEKTKKTETKIWSSYHVPPPSSEPGLLGKSPMSAVHNHVFLSAENHVRKEVDWLKLETKRLCQKLDHIHGFVHPPKKTFFRCFRCFQTGHKISQCKSHFLPSIVSTSNSMSKKMVPKAVWVPKQLTNSLVSGTKPEQ